MAINAEIEEIHKTGLQLDGGRGGGADGGSVSCARGSCGGARVVVGKAGLDTGLSSAKKKEVRS